jgi:cellulose biosynthesis protein BcsQ
MVPALTNNKGGTGTTTSALNLAGQVIKKG